MSELRQVSSAKVVNGKAVMIVLSMQEKQLDIFKALKKTQFFF